MDVCTTVLSCGGALSCVAMVAMAVFCLLEVDTEDFFTICYSISQAMLFAAGGAFVFVVESKVGDAMRVVRKLFQK